MFLKAASNVDAEGRPQKSDVRCEVKQRDADQSVLFHSWPIAQAPASRQALCSVGKSQNRRTPQLGGGARGLSDGAERNQCPSVMSREKQKPEVRIKSGRKTAFRLRTWVLIQRYGFRREFFSPVCSEDLQLLSYSKGKKGIPQMMAMDGALEDGSI